jgi:predicted RNase H-like HicB family nuclease
MRKGGERMSREFTVIIERGEDGYYIGTVPELKGCHTQGKTLDELMENVKEAVQLCLEVLEEEEKGTEFIGVQKIKV